MDKFNTKPAAGAGEGGRKRFWFRTFIILFQCAAGLVLGEFVLRWRLNQIKQSDVLDAGMVQYDPNLGWTLTPHWQGKHRCHDFDVAYSVNDSGFRGDTSFPEKKQGKLCLVVGDSFTFGLGANDDQTFVRLLNETNARNSSFLNCAVPGYSTDQEALLIESRLLKFAPDEITLVVYLANDLLDNPLAFPLQVSGAKPYFELATNGLVLRNTPVPLERKPPNHAPRDLTAAVLGADYLKHDFRARCEQRSELFRIVSQSLVSDRDYTPSFPARFAPALDLFARILDRITSACATKGVRLRVALMPGRSFVEQPSSVSWQYQEYFRKHVTEICAGREVGTIDLASLMRDRYRRERGRWFHPNDGHLTPLGHRVVAELLTNSL